MGISIEIGMRDRCRYLHWLFEAKKRFGLCVLNNSLRDPLERSSRSTAKRVLKRLVASAVFGRGRTLRPRGRPRSEEKRSLSG
jgi:hypothetical protein